MKDKVTVMVPKSEVSRIILEGVNRRNFTGDLTSILLKVVAKCTNRRLLLEVAVKCVKRLGYMYKYDSERYKEKEIFGIFDPEVSPGVAKSHGTRAAKALIRHEAYAKVEKLLRDITHTNLG